MFAAFEDTQSRKIPQLKKIPERLGRLRELEQICLNYCGLSSVTVTSGGMVSLTYLGLQNNDLKFVPPELSNFKRLKTLHLFGNRLTSDPPIDDILSSQYAHFKYSTNAINSTHMTIVQTYHTPLSYCEQIMLLSFESFRSRNPILLQVFLLCAT